MDDSVPLYKGNGNDETLHQRTKKKFSPTELKKMSLQQKSRYLAYEAPPKHVVEAQKTTKRRLLDLRNKHLRFLGRIWQYVIGLLITVAVSSFIFQLYQTNDELHIKVYQNYIPKLRSSEKRDMNKSGERVDHGPLSHHFHYDINQVNACDTSTELLIFVISDSSKTDSRKAIRKTWASKSSIGSYNIKVLFLFGRHSSERNDAIVEEEHKQYQDVIRANFVDNYDNLTLKSLSMLNWVLTYCRHTKYLLKSDDDVYVNTDVLMSRLRNELPESQFLLGRLQPSLPVIRKGEAHKRFDKWILSRSEYADDFFPAYMFGSAYAMSQSAIPHLYAASLKVNFIRIEDVFWTGLCANVVGVRRLLYKGWMKTWKPCTLRHHAVSYQYVSPSDMYKLYKDLQNIVEMCDSST